VQISISARHGSLDPEQQAYLREKAEKLQKYFARIMSIEVEAEQRKNGWQVEVQVSAEHKHDFVAREEAVSPEAAMDHCVHKVEQQLRKYKEKVQDHRDAMPHGGTSPTRPVLPGPVDSDADVDDSDEA
jgi:putative sigma-54 modulation protein